MLLATIYTVIYTDLREIFLRYNYERTDREFVCTPGSRDALSFNSIAQCRIGEGGAQWEGKCDLLCWLFSFQLNSPQWIMTRDASLDNDFFGGLDLIKYYNR